MKIFKIELVGAIFSIMVVAEGMAATVVIDDFSEGNRNITSRGQTAWTDSGLNVLGGVRDGSAGCENSDTEGLTTANISDGLFSVSTNPKGAPSIYLSYDGTSGWEDEAELDANPFNGSINPVQDLTDNGSNDRFSITFAYTKGASETVDFFNDFNLAVKVGGSTYLVDVSDVANVWVDDNYAELSADTPTAVSFEVLFSDFGDDVDMSEVEGFYLHVCSENLNMEYAIDEIAAVPEPAAAALLLVVGGGLLFVRRLFAV
jgi:hypothetical protein